MVATVSPPAYRASVAVAPVHLTRLDLRFRAGHRRPASGDGPTGSSREDTGAGA